MTRLAVLWLVSALVVGAAAAQEVTLPLSQYEQLRARANPEPEEPPAPPTPFALESDDLEIMVGASSARIVQRLALTVFVDCWVRVPLGEAGSFTAARFGDLEGRVEVSDEGGWALQVHGRGRHEVTLESVVPVQRDEAATRPVSAFSLRLPPAAVLRGTLETEAGVDEVRLTGNGLLRGEAGGPWSFVASFEKDAEVTFSVFGRRTLPERAKLPLRYDATSVTVAVLSRTQLRVTGWIEARVAQGQITELRVPVPPGFEVVSATGLIAGWDVKDKTLLITPQEPEEGTLWLGLELTAAPPGAFASPLLTPEGSRRTVHMVKAALQGDGLLTLVEPGAVRAPEASETANLPAAIRTAGGRMLVVSDPARLPRWEVEWADGTDVLAAQVDRLLLDVAIGVSGRAVYRLWAEVRNRGAQQLVVSPPAGFELTSARRDGAEVIAGSAAQGLAVPLLTRDAVQVVHLDGVVPLPLAAAGKRELVLPLPALSVPAARIEVRVVLPGGRSWQLAEGSRASPIQAPPRSSFDANPSVNALGSQVNFTPTRNSAESTPLGLFPIPPGYVEITAAWSALSANPGPLVLRVETVKEATPWI
jgi:hypothetical protein